MRLIYSSCKFQYNRRCSPVLGDESNLSPRRKIVDNLISDLVDAFVKAKGEYLSFEKVYEIADKYQAQGVDFEHDLIAQLESEGFITVEFAYGSDEEEVRFSFQRFCDYIIAEKLLSEHLDTKNVANSFAEGSPLIEELTNPDNYSKDGIIEAISIQLPELTGSELIDYLEGWAVEQGFKNSLCWRKQETFSERTFSLIEECFGPEEQWNTLIKISAESLNSFNADYLTQMLMPMGMPQRDAKWSAFLLSNQIDWEDDDNPANQLVDWAIINGFDAIDVEVSRLITETLIWFLTTSYRPLRDTASKALVTMLSVRPNLVISVLNKFLTVDDLYITERLVTATYGAALQGMWAIDDLRLVSEKVYTAFFAENSPPPNVLLRDSGRWLIEFSLQKGIASTVIDPANIRPPYKSVWPLEHVSDKDMHTYKQKYKSGYVGSDSIVSSVINDGDFARYKIDPMVSDWTASPIDCDDPISIEEIYENWRQKFLSVAKKNQIDAFERVLEAAQAYRKNGGYQSGEDYTQLKNSEEEFAELLPQNIWNEYADEIQNIIHHHLFPRDYPDDDADIYRFTIEIETDEVTGEGNQKPKKEAANFSLSWARRWICQKAHQLGWSYDLHGQFEENYCREGANRNSHSVERIGKKYQWLAFYELKARMADNLMKSRGYDEFSPYNGETNDFVRNLDPSFLIRGEEAQHYSNQKKFCWWHQHIIKLNQASSEEKLRWLYSSQDEITADDIILITNSVKKENWLALNLYTDVSQHSGRSNLDRKVSHSVYCIIVGTTAKDTAIETLKSMTVGNMYDAFKAKEFYSNNYLFEYPWHPDFADYTDWESKTLGHPAKTIEFMPTVCEYYHEHGSYDYSCENSLHVKLPTKALMNLLSISPQNGKEILYVNDDSEVIFCDPSLTSGGPSFALVKKDAFFQMLEVNDLTAIWILTGSKGVYSGDNIIVNFGGEKVFARFYESSNSEIIPCGDIEEMRLPDKSQISKFLNISGDIPDWVKYR